MTERPDKTTAPGSSRDVVFSDFTTSFKKHPVTGNLTRLTNDAAVEQALKNIILTDLGERPFQPTLGGDTRASLFEMIDNFTSDKLEESIVRTIRNCEQRVDQLKVRVTPHPNENYYRVEIVYNLYNSRTERRTEITLTRNR